jgi:CBS domain-containing protein
MVFRFEEGAGMQAKDIMSTDVVTVEEAASIKDILDLLLKHKISAVPVVDAEGKPVGVVSEADLLIKMKLPVNLRWLYQYAAYYYQDKTSDEQFKAQAATASEIMTRDPVSVDPHAEASKIAALMIEKNIKRVLVVKDGKLVGIVSRADILKDIITEKEK